MAILITHAVYVPHLTSLSSNINLRQNVDNHPHKRQTNINCQTFWGYIWPFLSLLRQKHFHQITMWACPEVCCNGGEPLEHNPREIGQQGRQTPLQIPLSRPGEQRTLQHKTQKPLHSAHRWRFVAIAPTARIKCHERAFNRFHRWGIIFFVCCEAGIV